MKLQSSSRNFGKLVWIAQYCIWPHGRMDKASAYGVRDGRFESHWGATSGSGVELNAWKVGGENEPTKRSGVKMNRLKV
eukprot:4628261-Amphidinium_carterae.1